MVVDLGNELFIMDNIEDSHPLILHSDNLESDPLLLLHGFESAPEYILERLKSQGTNGSTGIVDGVTGEITRYSDFEPLSCRFASSLAKRGFATGDILIYASDHAAKLHVCLLGVWRANGVVRGSYPEDLRDALLFRIEECNCKWVLCDTENLHQVKQCVAKAAWPTNLIVFGNVRDEDVLSVESLFNDGGEACPELTLRLSDTAAILPTSGTTGKSKGVVITHERLLTNLISVTDPISVKDATPSSTLLHLGKATHVSALMNFKFITEGRPLVRLRSKDLCPKNITKAVEDSQASEIILNGFLMQKVLTFAKEAGPMLLPSVKIINLIGTSVRFSTITQLMGLAGSPLVALLYGSTETLSLCYGDTSREMMDKLATGATGKLVAGVSLAVRSPSGQLLGPGIKGELWFKSRHSAIGYYQNAKETAACFQNSWVFTGDEGFYDQDGFVYLCGRTKEVFKYAGNHVSPLEIEEVLMTHVDVEDACVIGDSDPNGLGYLPKGYVVLRQDSTASSADLIVYANERLPPYMHLGGGVNIVGSLPYGPGGKVQRHLLS